jgi:hypothetical protein
MTKALKVILLVATVFVTSGVASAQQYGIGRFERVQILANDLENATRALYLRQERQWPRYRGDVQILRNLYRLHNQAANFENQIQRNFRDRERINLEFRRLSSTLRETEYYLSRMSGGRGYHYSDLRVVSNLVNDLGRSLYAYGDRYRDRDRDYDGDDYDNDRDDDEDDYDYDD